MWFNILYNLCHLFWVYLSSLSIKPIFNIVFAFFIFSFFLHLDSLFIFYQEVKCFNKWLVSFIFYWNLTFSLRSFVFKFYQEFCRIGFRIFRVIWLCQYLREKYHEGCLYHRHFFQDLGWKMCSGILHCNLSWDLVSFLVGNR